MLNKPGNFTLIYSDGENTQINHPSHAVKSNERYEDVEHRPDGRDDPLPLQTPRDTDPSFILSPVARPPSSPTDPVHISRRTEILNAVNKLALELTTVDPNVDTDQLVCDRLRMITNSLATTISRFDWETKTIRITHVASKWALLQLTNRTLKINLLGHKISVPPEIIERWKTVFLETFEGTYDLFLGRMPRTFTRTLDRILGIGYTYGLVLRYGNQVFGTLTIVTEKGTSALPEDLLETFCSIASASYHRMEAQRKINDYQNELRGMATEISLAEERERRRIASALHDDVTQALALMEIKLDGLHVSQEEKDSLKVKDELAQLLEKSIDHVRTLTFDLSPPILYELGLQSALEWLAERMSQEHGIAYSVVGAHSSANVDSDLQVFLFQAVRELLINVRKHAQAAKAVITIAGNTNQIRLEVADNGRGFQRAARPQHRRDGGFGLFNIEERIRRLGGKLAVSSTPGQGTAITLTAPLIPAANDNDKEIGTNENHLG